MFFSIAVLIAGGIGATAVFLVGSAQRRDDRRAILAYERSLTSPLREGGRIVQEEMKPSLGELASGELSSAAALGRASAWRRVLEGVRSDVSALTPPSFLGDIEQRWKAAMDGYLAAADLFGRAASAGPGAERTRLLSEAANAGTRADKLFDAAAAVIQSHRRRLGLGPTTSLPDPGATSG